MGEVADALLCDGSPDPADVAAGRAPASRCCLYDGHDGGCVLFHHAHVEGRLVGVYAEAGQRLEVPLRLSLRRARAAEIWRRFVFDWLLREGTPEAILAIRNAGFVEIDTRAR